MTQPSSASARNAAKRTLSEASLRAMQVPRDTVQNERSEVLPALFEVAVLVKRGACGREENGVPRPCGRGGRGKRVLEIVETGERDVAPSDDPAALASDLGPERVLAHVHAAGNAAHRRKADSPRRGGEPPADGVVLVQDGGVVARLVFEDPRFGRNVALERSVPVNVIGRDVRHDSDVRPEAADRLELEARHL